MKRKDCLITILILLLIGMVGLAIKVERVKAHPSIIIKADGGVDPPGSPISTVDNITYTFTADISEPIVVERDNIVIDGASHTLYGGGTFSRGIDLIGRNNVTISGIEIRAFWTGISLWDSSDIKVYGNNLTANNAEGLHLVYSSNNKIFENNITANRKGVYLFSSSNNTMYGNRIANHHGDLAVYITNSFNNTLYENIMNDNNYDLEVHGLTLEHFMHSINGSNLVDGKPIYYLINQTDLTINPATYPQVGYLALINCLNATVKNLNLTSNGHGLLLAYTNNSIITDNYITNNFDGIWLYASFSNTIFGNNLALSYYYGIYLDGNSSNNFISRNNITNNAHGIELNEVSNNMLHGNNITDNEYGIYLWKSSNCIMYENTLTNNDHAVWLESESTFPNNTFYHNNFLDNYQHVHIYTAGSYISGHNFWDNGVEGNYWNNYTGADTDNDGIGNALHVIDANNTDRSPLMGMFSNFQATPESNVQTICNSTVSNFTFNGTAVGFTMSGQDDTGGFCRITIPTALMKTPFKVLVNGTEVSYTLLPASNSTHSVLYFTYEHSAQDVVIIPEFLSLLVLPIFMMATLLATMVYRRRKTLR